MVQEIRGTEFQGNQSSLCIGVASKVLVEQVQVELGYEEKDRCKEEKTPRKGF